MKKFFAGILILSCLIISGLVIYHYGLTAKSVQKIRQKERKILYWVAPMDPHYRRDKPGKSPMGMDLVPVYDNKSEDDEGEGIINISSAVEQNLGVKTAYVRHSDLARVINTVGYVMADENTIEHIHTYTDGWIKLLKVKTTGELVHKGQLLLALYSPTVINAQEEYLLALNNKNDLLIRASEKKLITLGMARSQIEQLRKTKQVIDNINIYSTQDGIVSMLNVREGTFVKPDLDIMTIEDLSQIWIMTEVFERQANWVKKGQPAITTLPFVPGKIWQGNVDYVYPALDQQTHTLRVRLSFPNPDLTFKPNMYANVKILSKEIKNALVIPRSALIQNQEGNSVIKALGKGRFKSQPVTVGIESGDHFQILSGLEEGDIVVTSAQFLIDSESNLKASFARMQEDSQADLGDRTISMPKTFVGQGKIKSLDISNRVILIHHQPIPALNMPAMTMALKVVGDINLADIKVGDSVHFVLIHQANDTYLITKIRKVK